MLKVVAFDMDGVLIVERSSWSVLHRAFGSKTPEEERADAQAFLQGEIGYGEWVRRDIEAIVRVSGCVTRRDLLKELLSKVNIALGVHKAVSVAKSCGLTTAIVTGGVGVLAEYLSTLLDIDYVIANDFSFDSRGCLEVKCVEVVNPARKDEALRKISESVGAPLKEFMYVGDSFWDVPAFRVVGYPVLVRYSDKEVIDIARSLGRNPLIVNSVYEVSDLILRLALPKAEEGFETPRKATARPNNLKA